MYKFPSKLKIGAIVLMALGLVMTAISFMNAPKTLEEAKIIMAEQANAHAGHGGHEDSHNAHSSEHKTNSHSNTHEVNTVHHSDKIEVKKKVIVRSASESLDFSNLPKVNETKSVVKNTPPTKKEKSSDSNHSAETTLSKDTTSNAKEVTNKLVTLKDKAEDHTSKTHDVHKEEVKHVEGSLAHGKDDNHVDNHSNSGHKSEDHTTSHTDDKNNHADNKENQEKEDTHGVVAHTDKNNHTGSHSSEGHVANDSHGGHDDHHAEHVFHQLQNRPVSAFYVAMLFFLGITLLVMAFYAGQRIAQSGWSVVIFRVFEAITNNLHYVSVVMLLFIIGTAMHKFHLFPWMKEGTVTPGHPNFDDIIFGKKWFLNIPGWTIRSIAYLTIWNVLRIIIRKMSIKQDNGDLKLHKRLFNMSVAFVGTFLVTESMMSWDWIMGIDPHWFSTLFGWYVLATFLVCALTVTAMVTIYLRSQGFLPLVNDSHIHDLAKFMFGFSVFWTYLWFAQYMLVWYADMPEETTYFVQRFNDYKLPFLIMLVMNFLFPVLVLLNSDFKSIPWFVIIAGVVILAGHYIDLYVMIMPGTVGDQYGFGIGEIGGLLFFLGMFIYATFSAFAKADPVPKGNPFLHESETFHYYIIEHRGESKNDHH